jgi:hypothetical protein
MSLPFWIRRLFARPVSRPARKAPARRRPALEALEDRLAPSVQLTHGGPGPVLSPPAHASGAAPSVTISQPMLGQPRVGPFDITTFTYQIPAAIDAKKQFIQGNLMFVSSVDRIPGNTPGGNETFGNANNPTWVLIGLRPEGGTFTPMLLVYGVTTLFGTANKGNAFTWTGGLYTVSNRSTDHSVVGGFQLRIGAGKMFGDALVSTGVPVPITSIVNGTVTTSKPHGLAPGSIFQFDSLSGGNSAPFDQSKTYFVVKTIGDNGFTFTDDPTTDAPNTTLNATGGNVKVPDGLGGPDQSSWGVEVEGSLDIDMLGRNSSVQNVGAGFTPLRMLLTTQRLGPTTRSPMLQFQGTQSLSYQGSTLRFGVGGETANNAKLLTIDAGGKMAFLDTTSNQNVVTFTAGIGRVKTLDVDSVTTPLANGASLAVLTTTDDRNQLVVGDAFKFTGLTNIQGNLSNGKTYYVVGLSTANRKGFYFSDTSGGARVTGATATGGSMGIDVPFVVGPVSLTGTVQVVLRLTGDIVNVNNSDFAIGPMEVQIYGQVNGTFKAGPVTGSFSVAIGSNNGASAGITIRASPRGITVPDWGFSLDGSAQIGTTVQLSFTNVTVTHSLDSSGKGRTVIDGAVRVAVPGWNTAFEASMGRGLTDGLVFVQGADGVYRLQSFDVRIDVTRTKPSDGTSIKGSGIHIFGMKIEVSGKLDAGGQLNSLDVSGQVTLAIGDTTNQQGDWSDNLTRLAVNVTPGFVRITKDGVHLVGTGSVKVNVSGAFQVGPVTIGAQNLSIMYSHVVGPDGKAQDVLLLSGTATFTVATYQLAIQLGDGGNAGGLKVDVDTGQWQLDGWQVVLPSLNFRVVQLQGVTIGFTQKAPNDYDVNVAGSIGILGTAVQAKVDVESQNGHAIFRSIGVSLRGLNPGIAIPGTEGAFLTDLGFEVDQSDSGNKTIEGLLGGTFGNKITVGGQEYSLAQLIVNGTFTTQPFSANVNGTLLLGGGLLGQLTAQAQYDSAPYLVAVDVNGTFVYGVFSGQVRFVDTSQAFGFLGTLALQVPSFVPVIGGLQLAQVGAAAEVSHQPGGPHFIAGWFDLFGVSSWKVGLEYDFTTQSWSYVHGSEIDGLIGQLPSGVINPPPNQVTVNYDPQQGAAATAPPQYSSALFHVPVVGNDPTTQIWVTVDGTSAMLWQTGQQTGQSVDVGGVRFRVSDGASQVGGVTFLATKVPAQGETADDPYLILPPHQYAVSLVSGTPQPDPGTDPTKVGWSGSFSAPPPQAQSLSVTQPLGGPLARAGGSDPNLATVKFQYRTLNPANTTIRVYADFDGRGYDGDLLQTVQASDLNSGPPDQNHWQNAQVNVDLSNLPPFPVYIYAVVSDDTHAPFLVPYAPAPVVPTPEIDAGVTIVNGGSALDLLDWRVELDPVTQLAVSGVTPGSGGQPSVVHTAAPENLQPGQVFAFGGLTGAVGLANSKPYYVVQVLDDQSFTLAESPTLPPLTDAAAGKASLFYDTPGATPLAQLTTPHGHTSFNPDVTATGHYYRLTVQQKQPGYQALADTSPGVEQWASDEGDLVQYVYVAGRGIQISPTFNYQKLGMIQGRIYNDLNGSGQRQLADPGVPNVSVYLDENNNGQYDIGEPITTTGPDGVYRFLHDFTPPPTSLASQETVVATLRPFASTGVRSVTPGLVSRTAALVTTTAAHGFNPGDVFQFQGLQHPVGVQNGQTYYVVSVPSPTTFTFAAAPNGPPIFLASAGAGTAVGALTTLTPHNLQVGTPFTFNDLGSPAHVANGQTYYVTAVPTANTFFFSATRGGPISANAAATGGAVLTNADNVLSTPVARFANGIVTTAAAHGLRVNQAIVFTGLQSPTDVVEGQTYYVAATPSPTTFTVALQPGGPAVGDAAASGVNAAVVASADGPPANPQDPYTVTVRQMLPDSWRNTASPANPVTISSQNPQSTGNDFLDAQQVLLSGTVFNDRNHNGQQDPGEPGVPGVQVAVTPPGQTSPVTLTTDANGFWQATFDAHGTYHISVVPPGGATQTAPLSAVVPGTVVKQSQPAVPGTVGRGLAGVLPNPDVPGDYLVAVNSTLNGSDYAYMADYQPASSTSLTESPGFADTLRPGQTTAQMLSADVNGDGKLDVLAVVQGQDSSGKAVTTARATGFDGKLIGQVGNSGSHIFAVAPGLNGASAPPGLVSVDALGAVWGYDLTAPGKAPVALAQTSGAPVAVVTGPFDSAATGAPAIAVLSQANSQVGVTFLYPGPDGTYAPPPAATPDNFATAPQAAIDLPGQKGVALITGHFNDDSNLDLAALTYDTSGGTFYLTFLVNDGHGHFTTVQKQLTGSLLQADGTPATNLLARDLLADGRDEVEWTVTAFNGQGPQLLIGTLANGAIQVTATPISTAGLVAVGSPGNPASGDYGTALVMGLANLQKNAVVQTVSHPFSQKSYDVSSPAGGDYGGYNFGLSVPPPPPATSNTVSGVVFSDINGNGRQDPGEPDLPGYTVQLVGGGVVQTVQSGLGSSPGGFRFTNAFNDSFLTVVPPANGQLTTPWGTNDLGFAPFGNLGNLIGGPIGGPIENDAMQVGDLLGTGKSQVLAVLGGPNGATNIYLWLPQPVVLPSGTPGNNTTGGPKLDIADLDGDGLPDLIASAGGVLTVLFNQGGGHFGAPQTLLQSNPLPPRGDGVSFTVVPGQAGGLPTVYAIPQMQTAPVTPFRYDPQQGAMVAGTPFMLPINSGPDQRYLITDLTSADLNGDGQIDLVGYDHLAGKAFALLGPDFTQAVETPVDETFNQIAVTDLNGDGKQEMVLLSDTGPGGGAELQTVFYRNGQLLTAAPTVFTSPGFSVGGPLPLRFGSSPGLQTDLVMGFDAGWGPGGNQYLVAARFTGDLDPGKPAFVVAPQPSVQEAPPGDLQPLGLAAVGLADFNGDGQLAPVTADRQGNLTSWYGVLGGRQVTGLGGQTQSGGNDLGVHLAGSDAITIQGTVFHDLNNNGQWDPSEPGLHDGVRVYVDLNNNGRLDDGEPSVQPSLAGAYSFNQLPPGTYTVRLALGADDLSPTTMHQTLPANNAAVKVTVDALGGVAYGADFGVYIDPTSGDFNNDGYPDLVVVDPSTSAVYVELRHPAARGPLATYRIGTLPGPQWRVAGVGDFNGDGWQDILVQDTRTGRLKLWQMTGGERPSLNQALDLAARVPAGWRLAAVADYNGDGTPDLLLQNRQTAQVVVWEMQDGSVIGHVRLPRADVQGTLVGASADTNGNLDLFWQKGRTLLATPLRGGRVAGQVTVGSLPAGWVVADTLHLSGAAMADVLIENPRTGQVRYLTAARPGKGASAQSLDLGVPAGKVMLVQQAGGAAPPPQDGSDPGPVARPPQVVLGRSGRQT